MRQPVPIKNIIPKVLKQLRKKISGGYSSVGRTSDCGSGGHGFDPRYPPQKGYGERF